MKGRSAEPATNSGRLLDPVDIDPAAVAAALQRQSLENFLGTQWVTLIPIILLACASFFISDGTLLLAILGLQGAALLAMRQTAKAVLAALDEGRDPKPAIARRTLSVAASGATWGLAMLPVADRLDQGVAPMFVCLILVVTVGLSAMLSGLVPRYVYAGVAGFTATLLPQTIIFLPQIGPIPLVATLGYAPALIALVRGTGQQAMLSLRRDLENRQLAEQLQSALDAAHYLSAHDSLTGMLNRRAFEREASAAQADPERAEPLAIILFDLDNFKSINDAHGHAAGDAVLRIAARTISLHIGSHVAQGAFEAVAARWGGEEFIVLLGRGADGQAHTIAEALRYAVEHCTDRSWPDGVSVTASFGVAHWAEDEALHEAIGRADQALYRAKQLGRNRVEFGDGADSDRRRLLRPIR